MQLERRLISQPADSCVYARACTPQLRAECCSLWIQARPHLGWVVLGELVQTTAGKWITHPPAHCPNGHSLGPGQVLVGHQSSLPRTRRRTHHLDLPSVRSDNVRAAAQRPLHHPRRACDRAHPQVAIEQSAATQDPHRWQAECSLQHSSSYQRRRHPTIGRNGPRLGAPDDVPKRTSDAAPPWPVAPVSTVAPASSVAPVSIVAMAPIAPVASILLPQNSRGDGRRLCRARDARTKANGAEPQCTDHRGSGRNLLQTHCQTPFLKPYEVATLGSLCSCPRSAIWCNPRRSGESRTAPTDTVSGKCSSGITPASVTAADTTWTCRICDQTVYRPPLNTHSNRGRISAHLALAGFREAERGSEPRPGFGLTDSTLL